MTDASTKEPLIQLKGEVHQAEAATKAQAGAAPPIVPRPVRRYRALVFQGYILAAIIGFGVLLFYARTVAYFTFDLAIERWVQNFNPPWFDWLMQLTSDIGFSPQVYLWSGLVILIVFLIGLRWESLMLTFSGLGVGGLGALIKIFVQRERPTDVLVRVFSKLPDYSFPSGHVLYYVAFIGFIFFLIYTLIPNSMRRTLGLIAVAVPIVLIGISRIYLGQHWPSDVLGAYLLGSLWLALTISLYRWGKPRFFVNQPQAPENNTAPIPKAS